MINAVKNLLGKTWREYVKHIGSEQTAEARVIEIAGEFDASAEDIAKTINSVLNHQYDVQPDYETYDNDM